MPKLPTWPATQGDKLFVISLNVEKKAAKLEMMRRERKCLKVTIGGVSFKAYIESVTFGGVDSPKKEHPLESIKLVCVKGDPEGRK